MPNAPDPGALSSPTVRPSRWAWVPVLLWMALIFHASADAGSGEDSGALTQWLLHAFGLRLGPEGTQAFHHGLRKLGHLTEYGVLAILLARAHQGPWPRQAGALLWVWILCGAYAISDELHQALVPRRGPALTDVFIDATGAAMALLVGSALAVWWRGRTLRSGPRS